MSRTMDADDTFSISDIDLISEGVKEDSSSLSLENAPMAISSSTSFDSGLTTPIKDVTTDTHGDARHSNANTPDEEKWKIFYELHLEKTPPKATRAADFDAIIEAANKVLEYSESPMFQDKKLDMLSNDQQAILLFMILKGMHKVFHPPTIAPRALVLALVPKSDEYNRMMSFVRKGGDQPTPLSEKVERSYSYFLSVHPEWNSEAATTIFQSKPGMEPVFHIQDHRSYLCTYLQAASMIHYHSYDESVGDNSTIKVNVGRFIRDEVSAEKIANVTLTDVKGAHLDEVINAVLKSFGTLLGGGEPKVEKISVFEDDADLTFLNLTYYIKMGRPVAFAIEALPAFTEGIETGAHKSQFIGTVSDHIGAEDFGRRATNPKNRPYHALLCVGVLPRTETMPHRLLVQDTNAHRPFFVVGLDLLMDMGLRNLQFCVIPEEWKPNLEMEYNMPANTRPLISGYPMAISSNGFPYIVKTEEPAPERRDMSRYCEIITIKKGDPPLCFLT